MSEFHCAVHLPRNAFSPREAARAADVWRGFQDVAVAGSSAGGWTPERYVQEGNAFVIRRIEVTHLRELAPKDQPRAVTWIRRVRREIVSEREIRMYVGDELVASASQEWVHVDRSHKIAPCPQSLIDAFTPIDMGEPPAFPTLQPVTSAKEFTWTIDVWHTWMDALGHVNHPMYVDWCEEALARTLIPLGVSATEVVPHGERFQYRAGALAGDTVTVKTRLVGVSGDRLAFAMQVLRNDNVCTEATLVRSLRGGSEAWLKACA